MSGELQPCGRHLSIFLACENKNQKNKKGTITQEKAKQSSTRAWNLCRVDVYPLEVSKHLKTWREKGQREQRWFEIEEAAHQVLEPALAELIRRLPAHVQVPQLAEA